jgi:ankyrin repeat protein
MRSGFRTMFYVTYRDASDEELAEYVKHLDTDVGRWGLQLLAGAQRTAVESRVRPFAKEVAQIAVRSALAKGKATTVAVAAEEEKPAEKPVAEAAAAAPAEAPLYKRAANTRELYSRYNDLITAAVMQDRAAVKELLADGKYPDVRQKDGVTPLMIAAANGDVETASMLLGKGADPNLRAAGGKSALSLARQRGAGAMVQLLQSKGAQD